MTEEEANLFLSPPKERIEEMEEEPTQTLTQTDRLEGIWSIRKVRAVPAPGYDRPGSVGVDAIGLIPRMVEQGSLDGSRNGIRTNPGTPSIWVWILFC